MLESPLLRLVHKLLDRIKKQQEDEVARESTEEKEVQVTIVNKPMSTAIESRGKSKESPIADTPGPQSAGSSKAEVLGAQQSFLAVEEAREDSRIP